MIRIFDNLWLASGPNLTHPWDANAYLVNGEEPTMIDCGSSKGYAALKDGLRALGLRPQDIRRVLATHGHWDHLSGMRQLAEEGGAELWIHAAERAPVETGDQELTASFLYGEDFPVLSVDSLLKDGQRFCINGWSVTVVHTPGHSPGSVCFLLQKARFRLLVAGDTLWAHGHPRIGSDVRAWQHSLHRLLELDFDLVTTGHMAATLLLDAKRRIQEARMQLGTYYYPWFKPFHYHFRY